MGAGFEPSSVFSYTDYEMLFYDRVSVIWQLHGRSGILYILPGADHGDGVCLFPVLAVPERHALAVADGGFSFLCGTANQRYTDNLHGKGRIFYGGAVVLRMDDSGI